MTPPTNSSFRLHPGTHEKQINRTLKTLLDRGIKGRLLDRDPSLWSDDPEIQIKIKNRLGWMVSHVQMAEDTLNLKKFARDIRDSGIRDVVLLGMGGSSLTPEVFRMTFGVSKGYPALHVLDTTDPTAIGRIEHSVGFNQTLFIVASKSGATLEVQNLYRFFCEKVKSAVGSDFGKYFIAITDPGTPLEKLAREENFRQIFLNPADIGGRYSALSFFGLVPAALIGVDPDRLLKTVDPIIAEMIALPGEMEETVLPLGTALGELALAGIDKVTFFLSPSLQGFGLWVEQLLAESTGKEGKGVIPVDGEPLASPKCYADDRFFILIETADETGGELSRSLDHLEAAGHPTLRITLRDRMELGGEFLRWEIATAVCGIVLGVNPFDEPNVTESKENTRKVLKDVAETGSLPQRTPTVSDGTLLLFEAGGQTHDGSLEKALWNLLEGAVPPDYVALMAYLDNSEEHNRVFQQIRIRIRNARRTATTLGYGPRFLHSTGQLHKGGPATGIFIQITAEESQELPIPGEPYGFGVLKQAQARGDLNSLTGRGLRAVNIHLGQNTLEDLKRLSKIIDKILV